ncbi:Co2+/Mg2+ efflux protein ApaG [Deinococcus sp.]|uniref:Co2+/Mg2+ efflux protein ApaG n=1 Tax=Deinococcus sp. TaxID=47478 RepID=UPI0025F9F147|nr:Co2+/Mg2+ efflux protein ApaG [Deinococcus sp.]
MSETAAPGAELSWPDVRVDVSVTHLSAYSRPGRQVFTYVIRIENHAPDSWQVIARAWQITDGTLTQTEVQGEGVVGQQPIIAPGGVYVYDSFVTLEALPGQMSGHYELRDAWGRAGRVKIPAFLLNVPEERTLN